ncbi:MAG: hypothetical protein Q4C82_06305 [Eubacteriales bacterium]|nr:hypothetical protein [Eubacteriales bacterium]
MTETIQWYHRLYLFCLAGLTPGLLLSAALYIRLDMRAVLRYFMRSGAERRRRKKGREALRKESENRWRRPLAAAVSAVLTAALCLWAVLCMTAHGEETANLRIQCPEAVRLFRGDAGEELEGEIPRPGDVAYYSDSIHIRIFVPQGADAPEAEESDAAEPEVPGTDPEEPDEQEADVSEPDKADMPESDTQAYGELRIFLDRDGGVTETAVEWEQTEDGFAGELVIEADAEEHSADGVYRLTVRRVSADGEEETAAESPVLVLDTTPPEVEIFWEEETADAEDLDGWRAYGQGTHMTVRIREANGRYRELREALLGARVTDLLQEPVENRFAEELEATGDDSRTAEDGTDWEIRLSSDGRYEIPVEYEDLAGNRVSAGTVRAIVDREAPRIEILCRRADGASAAGGEEDLLQREPVAVNYREHGWWFSAAPTEVAVRVQDRISGVKSLKSSAVGEDGQEAHEEQEAVSSWETELCFSLPLQGDAFKGIVQAEASDRMGNAGILVRSAAVEGAKRHEAEREASVGLLTEPSRVVDGERYYRSDVRLRIRLRDAYSGLGKISFGGGSVSMEERDFQAEAGTELSGEPASDITFAYEKELTLEAASNNENEICIRADMEDNAGHTEHAEQSFHIDTTAPVVTVEYDLEEPVNGRFYAEPRTAVVAIRERNLDPDDVEFLVTGTDGAAPRIGAFESRGEGDDTRYECRVVFSEDGDYTFSVRVQDKAGNWADYDRTDRFTIDRTPPELRVTWDQSGAENGRYYRTGRRAVIEITERNFDPSRIGVTAVTETAAGQAVVDQAAAGLTAAEPTAGQEAQPVCSGWITEGERHWMTVLFEADGDYMLDVSGTDQAGNPLADFETERFTVDRTPPALSILGVEDRSANAGTVAPTICGSDRNYQKGTLLVRLTGVRGGEQDAGGVFLEKPDGEEVALADFARTQETDDLYVLEASCRDLAGNESHARICFSVNRFGSVYTFDERTGQLAGREQAFVREGRELVVTETNVDTLLQKEIILDQDGHLRVLREGEDYAVDAGGTDESWKQYTYRIFRKNFEKEGAYELLLGSRDRAENDSDNIAKGNRLAFIVDRTAPDIVLAGVEDGGRYWQDGRRITLDIQDNFCLEEAKVTINGETSVYDAEKLAGMDGRLTIFVKSGSDWQTLRVRAVDRAGNESEPEPTRFLITENALEQLSRSDSAALGAAGLALLLAAAGTTALGKLAGRRKRRLQRGREGGRE